MKREKKMQVEVRFISDRQDLIQEIKLRKLGIDRYMYDRLDMYWLDVKCPDGQTGTYCVEPDLNGGWYIAHHGGASSDAMRDAASEFFSDSEYEANMKKWIKNLCDANYFEEGRYPGKNTNVCPHCHGTYAIGTSHEHKKFDNGVWAHNARQYQKALDLGLQPNWRPGCNVEDPSEEELGVIKLTPIPRLVGKSPPDPVSTKLILPKQKFYFFMNYSHTGVQIVSIILATSVAECVEKVMAKYDLFDEFFKDHLLGMWSKGGLYNHIHSQGPFRSKSDYNKIRLDKEYRRKLIEENKENMLVWINAYDEGPDYIGTGVTVRETADIIQ